MTRSEISNLKSEIINPHSAYPPAVAITGVGLVTPLGTTAEESARAWSGGRAAERRRLPELAGTALEHAEAAAPPDFDPAGRLGGRRMLKYMGGAAMLGCVAAREALRQARALGRFAPERIGLYAATGLAAASVEDIRGTLEASIDERGEFSERLLGLRGLAATNPLISFKILANMPPCLISIIEGLKGPSLIFTPWEGQAGAALLEAWQAVRSSAVDCALSGAADTPAHPSTLVYLKQAGLLGEGETPASGAGYLVLERAAEAAKTGQPIYGIIEDITLAADESLGAPPSGRIDDPLASRIGRMFAAAPPVLLGLECLAGGVPRRLALSGVDRQRFEIRLGGIS